MPVFKNESNGTWYVMARYVNWKGERKQKCKRGFATKKEAQEWERMFQLQNSSDMDMSFEAFTELYIRDMKSRLKENTWLTKEHIIRTKILPYFGKLKISEISTKEVIAWQNEMLAYRDEKKKPYSQTYLKTLHNQLSATVICGHSSFYWIVSRWADENGFERKRNFMIQISNLSKKYGETVVFSDLNYTFENACIYGLVGRNGAGKTTLCSLIPRFYDATKGCVKVDGVDVRNMTQHELRDRLGYVPQKGVLFSGTIDSNIRYGKPDMPEEDVKLAAQIAQSDDFIEAKPEGYKAPISQGGNNVSGGQKQRLSIARAIAKKPEILIFDDSFSALDFKTDSKLRKALKEKTKDITTIIVAQRISTILNADQIIVLDDGNMTGIGTHKELMKNCEVYRQIAMSQLSEEELA